MGKASRKKPIKPTRRRSGSLGFSIAIAVVIALGILGIVLSRGSDTASAVGPDIGEHWHAALGINVCGEWKPNTPQYEAATGIHSHGDGFIHLHPGSRAGSNERATVGLFLDQAGEAISDKAIQLADGTDLKNGNECPNLDKKAGKVRWSVNGKEKKGDPSRYVPADGDVIALAFLPAGEEIGVPPVASAGQGPTDIPGAQPQQQIPQDLLDQINSQTTVTSGPTTDSSTPTTGTTGQ